MTTAVRVLTLLAFSVTFVETSRADNSVGLKCGSIGDLSTLKDKGSLNLMLTLCRSLGRSGALLGFTLMAHFVNRMWNTFASPPGVVGVPAAAGTPTGTTANSPSRWEMIQREEL